MLKGKSRRYSNANLNTKRPKIEECLSTHSYHHLYYTFTVTPSDAVRSHHLTEKCHTICIYCKYSSFIHSSIDSLIYSFIFFIHSFLHSILQILCVFNPFIHLIIRFIIISIIHSFIYFNKNNLKPN